MLLERNNIDFEHQLKAGKTVQFWAAHYGQADVVKFLLVQGLNLKGTHDQGRIPVLNAVGRPNVVHVEILVECHRVNTNFGNCDTKSVVY